MEFCQNLILRLNSLYFSCFLDILLPKLNINIECIFELKLNENISHYLILEKNNKALIRIERIIGTIFNIKVKNEKRERKKTIFSD